LAAQKQKEQEEKEMHSSAVRSQMEAREIQRINSIRSQRAQKDSIMSKTQREKEWALQLKREQELIKQEDKQENVKRIAKA